MSRVPCGPAARQYVACEECGELNDFGARQCASCGGFRLLTLYAVLPPGSDQWSLLDDPDVDGFFWDRFPHTLN